MTRVVADSFWIGCYFFAVTCLFDGFFLLAVSVPVAYFLSRYTSLPVYGLFLAVRFVDTLKCLFGLRLVRRGIRIHNMIGDEA